MASPDITRRDRQFAMRLNPVKSRGLPPPQLSHVHIHSDLLKQQSPSECTTNTTDDLEESVGSISAGNPTLDDDCESGDEQDSSHYSPVSSSGLSPSNLGHSRNAANHMNNVLKEAKNNGNSKKSEPLELGEFYERHLPASRRESFGKRDSFGQMDSFGRKEEKSLRNSLEGKENLDRIDSFALSGTRQGDNNTNGRHLSENKREDALSKKSCLGAPRVHIDDGDLSSDTELSDDETSIVELDDDDEDEEEGAVGWVPYRASLEETGTLAKLRLSTESGLVRYVSVT